MTISYGFFNSVNGDRKYNADDIGRYLHGLVSSGVYADETNSLQVVANGGMQIAVQPGRAMLDYHYMENDAPLVLELSAGGTMDRIDIVVARLDLSNRLCEIIVRTGTPASAPTRPIIYKTDLVKEYLLASIRVTKLATSITQSDITDTRADDTVCGWVRSIIGQGNAGIPVPAQSDADKVPVVKSDGSGYSLKNANELKMPGDVDMGGYRITTLGPPKNGTDAATADYVSNQIKTKVSDQKGAANGYAALDENKHIPTSYIENTTETASNITYTNCSAVSTPSLKTEKWGKIVCLHGRLYLKPSGTVNEMRFRIPASEQYYGIPYVSYMEINPIKDGNNSGTPTVARVKVDADTSGVDFIVTLESGQNFDTGYKYNLSVQLIGYL